MTKLSVKKMIKMVLNKKICDQTVSLKKTKIILGQTKMMKMIIDPFTKVPRRRPESFIKVQELSEKGFLIQIGVGVWPLVTV